MLVLAINSGSSSLKCAVVDPVTAASPFVALAERLGSPEARLRIEGAEAQVYPDMDHEAALAEVLRVLKAQPALWQQLGGVGHRVVHGGETFSASCLIDQGVLSAIESVIPLAPLHNPANLLGIATAQKALPHLPHVAVFDTAFHQTMPPHAYRYAVPTSWYTDYQVRRYGFHGTSHRYVSAQAAKALARPMSEIGLITAHLGNGCSLAAVDAGRSVDTTMGLTPLEGLVMGTRSGDIDPAIIFYMSEHAGLGVDAIKQALNKDSGLLGLSEMSNDMRTIVNASADHPAAALALDVFCHRLAKSIAALATNLRSWDALVFTGGIGEHAALVRKRVVERLQLFGLRLAPEANAAHATHIHDAESKVALLVIPTNEELLIAQDTADLVQASPAT